MSKRALSIIGLLAVMGVWGSTFTITKAALVDIPPLTFALYRFVVASTVLLLLSLPRLPQLFALIHTRWLMLILMGFFGISLYYLLYQFGLVYGSASQGAFIQALIPTATAVAAVVWLHEQMSVQRVLGIALSLLGVVLVILLAPTDALAPNPMLGALFMIGTVIVWVCYTVLAKKIATADTLLVTTASTWFGSIMLGPFAMFELQTQPLVIPSLAGWLSILYLGAISSAVCYLIYNWSLAQLDASQAANYLNLLPIIGVVIAVIFLNEAVLPIQLIGGLLILLGVWLTTSAVGFRFARRREVV